MLNLIMWIVPAVHIRHLFNTAYMVTRTTESACVFARRSAGVVFLAPIHSCGAPWSTVGSNDKGSPEALEKAHERFDELKAQEQGIKDVYCGIKDAWQS